MQFNFDGAHDNSRFARDFGKAAPDCFLNFGVYMHSAIHLHCSREQFFSPVCLVFVHLKKKHSLE
jgi:hypothetical protein